MNIEKVTGGKFEKYFTHQSPFDTLAYFDINLSMR